MGLFCRPRPAVAASTGMSLMTVMWCSCAKYTTLTPRLRCTATAASAKAAAAAKRGTLRAHFPQRCGCVGTGGSSLALFRPTRVARMLPQLARLLIAGSVALLQVFAVAYQRESRKLRQEEQARGAVGAAQDSTGMGSPRVMSAIEAMQLLGLDRDFPDLYISVQRAEASSASTSVSLPLAPGKAHRTARQNFERMFTLAIKEENMFLAGKLSAAYRICVDPRWDQATSGEEEASDKSQHTIDDEGKP